MLLWSGCVCNGKALAGLQRELVAVRCSALTELNRVIVLLVATLERGTEVDFDEDVMGFRARK